MTNDNKAVGPSFADDLRDVINKHSKETKSDTPDFVLAQFLNDCLTSFNGAMIMRKANADATKE